VSRWLSLAFDETEAIHATAAIGHHRGERAAVVERPRSYEVVVGPDETLLMVAERVMPRFAYHMECLGLPRAGNEGVFFSVFFGERIYFIRCGETVPLFEDVIRKAHPPLMLPGRKA
jgi:hypothetical protein